MKKILIVTAILASLTCSAQIQVGSNEIAAMNRAGKIDADDLALLQKTTTLFTLPFSEYDKVMQYEAAIKSVWTLTPFKIIRPDELADYEGKPGYSTFSFGGYLMQRQGSSTTSNNMHIAYDLCLSKPKKNGKFSTAYFARVHIYPDIQAFITALKNSNRKNTEFSSRMLNYIYNDATLYNWGPGFLKGYLKLVNDALLSNKERGPYTELENEKELAKLKNDTLYVPDYVNVKLNMFTGTEKEDDEKDEGSMKDAYPYPVRIVSTQELQKMILDAAHPIKYLVYTKSSTDKYINVFDSGSGAMIYARYSKMSFNFKNKDLGRLAKTIR